MTDNNEEKKMSESSSQHAGREKKNRHPAKRPSGKKQVDKKGMVDPELEERVVAVNRCAKVVKGGRRFSFSALLVLGDKNGRVGFGLGKAKEVPEAIRKAKMAAQKNMISFPLDGGTIPHEVLGLHDAGKIIFKPAAEGTGVKAAGACRAILEVAGIKNILTKSVRGNNPHNIVKATFSALKNLRSAKQIAEVRGQSTKSIRL